MQRIGVDAVSVDRIALAVRRSGPGFLTRAYTPAELAYCAGNDERLAGRWAAKEAVIKAWSGSRFSKRPMLPEGIHRDIEIVTDMWGRPRVRLSGAIAEHLKEITIHLSLTHEGDTAAAVAVLESAG